MSRSKTPVSARRLAGSAVTVALILALVAPALPALAQDQSLKIAIVDLDRVVIQSPLGQQMQGRLQQLQEQTQKQLQVHADKAAQIRQRAADGANTMTDEEVRRLQQELEDENIAGRRVQDNAQRQAKRIQDETLQKIQQQLRPVFEQLRDAGGYDLILNNAAGVVVIAKESVDITDQVLQTLNSGGQ